MAGGITIPFIMLCFKKKKTESPSNPTTFFMEVSK